MKISNFRNFENVDVVLSHKQIVIGENNVGKTNFLRAIQLILDPKISEEDRYLQETDFFDGIENPMGNGEEIEIVIEIQGFEHNSSLLAQLCDASIDTNPPTLRITYRYFPIRDDDETICKYEYVVFKGVNEAHIFTHTDRQLLNIKVINAIRDVESEIKNYKKSPLANLIKQYEIDTKDLEQIIESLEKKSGELLALDELIDLKTNINRSFSKLAGLQSDTELSLQTLEFEPTKLLNALKIMIGVKKRSISDSSLGLNNLLYISLILLALEDKTIPAIIKRLKFDELRTKEDSEILEQSYTPNSKGNYILRANLTNSQMALLYKFMDNYNSSNQGFTILAIEEPEAHVHPALQRVIYKDVISNSRTSVLMTTHSTHIVSVTPIQYMVHLLKPAKGGSTIVTSSSDIKLQAGDIVDLERYINANRGEIYFGKGVILVEGIAEQYLVPKFAELLGKPLDEFGIIVCNINSTNFMPYMKLLNELHIPFVAITDGDYYEIKREGDSETRKYHIMSKEDSDTFGYLGNEIIGDILTELGLIDNDQLKDIDFIQEDELFARYGCFVGRYTLEVDIMEYCSVPSKNIISDLYESLTLGGDKQKANFRKEMLSGEYWKCLSKIEGKGVGKGRFSQRFSTVCIEDHIPLYVKSAIEKIVGDVTNAEL